MKLDFGCGPSKREGFIGIDRMPFPGVDLVMDIVAKEDAAFKPWPWEDNSVDEAHAAHFIEHLTAEQRIHFVNEIYRILKPGGKLMMIVPCWSSCRAYGDLTHQWPPVSEFWFYYLSKAWRTTQAPHNDFYTCDFEANWGYNMDEAIRMRNPEYVTFATRYYKEACLDLICTLTKK